MNAALDLAEVRVGDAGHAGQLPQRQGRQPSLGPNERAQRLPTLGPALDCHSVSVPSAAQRECRLARFFAWMRGSRWMDSKAEEGANDDEGGRRMMILALSLLYELLVMILDLLSLESYKSKITTEKLAAVANGRAGRSRQAGILGDSLPDRNSSMSAAAVFA